MVCSWPMLEASCATEQVLLGYALQWDHLLVLFCFSARPLPFSMHRNMTLQVGETAPLPKKQVQATMSCFSGTTFYISHKTISCHCSTLPTLDSRSSFPTQTYLLGAGAAAFTKHPRELACQQLITQRDSHAPGPSVPKMWLRILLADVIFPAAQAIKLPKLRLMFEHDV